MLILSYILLISFSWIFIYKPVRQAQAKAKYQRFSKEYERFQLKTVQQYFPEAQNLSLNQIKELYDYKRSYDSLSLLTDR